jgi:hypothetical protein
MYSRIADKRLLLYASKCITTISVAGQAYGLKQIFQSFSVSVGSVGGDALFTKNNSKDKTNSLLYQFLQS